MPCCGCVCNSRPRREEASAYCLPPTHPTPLSRPASVLQSFSPHAGRLWVIDGLSARTPLCAVCSVWRALRCVLCVCCVVCDGVMVVAPLPAPPASAPHRLDTIA